MADNSKQDNSVESSSTASPTIEPRQSEQDGPSSSRSTARGTDDPFSTTRRRPNAPAASRSTLDSRIIPSPDPGASPSAARKPSYLRRTASASRTPHRGEFFSVDDAEEEVVLPETGRPKFASGVLRRQPSTLRRRPQPSSRLSAPLEASEIDEPVAASTTDAVHVQEPRSILEGDTEVDTGEVDDAGGDDSGITPDEDDAELSDAESFTLKDRQDAINETHPFGIRIWKPALYQKKRSVEKGADGDIHSAPGERVSRWLWLFNILWTLFFGWWLALVGAVAGTLCYLFGWAPGCRAYGRVLWGFAAYIFYPFGKYVKLIQEEAYVDEDEGAGRSITEYEQWQSGDIEEGRLFFGPIRSLVGRRREDDDSEDGDTDPLLERGHRHSRSGSDQATKPKRRYFGRGQWNLGRVIFFIFFYGLLTPLLFIVSMLCWLMVFTVPMARVSWLLLTHLRRRPLALEFHHDTTYTRAPGSAPSAIILCTYRAVGTKYWKYTIDGTNLILINLLGVVVFVIFDYWVLLQLLGLHFLLTNTIFMFLLALFSIIPLAYFIGQAVASISAQSTMGVGAVINAFFSTLVEVFLYCVALRDGKSQLVEGSVVGSIFCGILLLPGLSMCFGAVKRKTQRFNVKSAGVTTTMLLFAVIGAFGPTLFYQIYGAHELNCEDCTDKHGNPLDRDCRRCFFAQIPAVHDPFYESVVRPFCWLAAVALFVAYVIGLIFTLRTHAATIWNMEIDEKKEKTEVVPGRGSTSNGTYKRASVDHEAAATAARPPMHTSATKTDIRESHLYKRILDKSLNQAGITSPTIQPRKGVADDESITTIDYGTIKRPSTNALSISSLTPEDNRAIVRQMAEMAATAATVAARDSLAATGRKPSTVGKMSVSAQHHSHVASRDHMTTEEAAVAIAGGEQSSGGHDAPNWSRMKSYIVLLTATLAYAVIAEILVETVDSVLEHVDIDQKFLGITLFALVPNTTEFLNAISFAMNGNIALSMEIGSAYALQVCLLQIPALVLFSAMSLGFSWQDLTPRQIEDHAFTLIFPQWDMVSIILCVFLLSYMYGEGKSNYFKGSILLLCYLIVIAGFYAAGFSDGGVSDPNDPPDFYAHRGRGRGQWTLITFLRLQNQSEL